MAAFGIVRLGLANWPITIATLAGWRRVVFALVLGLLAAGAMPPFNLVPLLVPSLAPLLWLTDTASAKRAFWDGWCWSMGFFVPTLHWMAIPMFVDIGQFWWMIPFAVLGLPALLGCFNGLAVAVARGRGPAMFAACFVLAEFGRGHALTGFPWMLTGYAWSGDSRLLLAGLQTTSLIGIYGISFLTLWLAALPATLARSWKPTAIGAVAGIVLLGWGWHRMGPGPDPVVPHTVLRIISTDLPHRAEWDPVAYAVDFHHLLSLAEAPGHDRIAAEIWPEGDVETELNQNDTARDAVADAAPPHGIVLAGTLRGEGTGAKFKVWNNITAIDAAGQIVGSYDKHHLVPFGEYVPYHSLFAFSAIAQNRFDFSTGPGPQTLDLPGLPPVAPIICYEAIFPHQVVDETHRAGWLVNVTDDGWFGAGIGPAQHFAMARVRAVEEGMPLARAANGGTSGLIDAHGRTVAALPLAVWDVLDVALPQALPGATLYGRMGNWPVMVFAALLAISGLYRRRLSAD